MILDLAITPSGRIAVHQSDNDREGREGDPRDRTSDRRLAKVVKAFESSPAGRSFRALRVPARRDIDAVV